MEEPDDKSLSTLRAAVYQRILTDNIVGIDLQENDTTKWHDKELKVSIDGSSVVSHDGIVVSPTPSLKGRNLDEKILSIANVFRLIYQKRRYDVEDTPLWWLWKHGNVEMRIALQRMHRWIYSTRPMDVIALMRYAMTTFYVLADEGVPIDSSEVVFQYEAKRGSSGIFEYRKIRRNFKTQLRRKRNEDDVFEDAEADDSRTDLAIAVRLILDSEGQSEG